MELLESMFAQVLANLVTIIIGAVIYWNFLLFKDYIWTVLWAFVISQALLTGKKRLVRFLEILSDQKNADKKLIAVAWAHLMLYLSGPGGHWNGVGALLWWLCLDNAVVVFAIAGWIILLCHLVPWYSVLSVFFGLFVIPMGVILYFVDRKIFSYRRIISDDFLAATVMVSLFLVSLVFISFFLGTESVIEGIGAYESALLWVQSTLEADPNSNAWSSLKEKGAELSSTAISWVKETYEHEPWWGIIEVAVKKYSELDRGDKLWDLGIHGWIRSFQSFLADLFRLDGVTEFFASLFDGKTLLLFILNGLNLFAVILGFFCAFGFKTLLFFTCLFSMLTKVDILEKIVNDLLPVPEGRKDLIKQRLQKEIEGTFFIVPKIACFHGLVTLALFTVLRMEFCFFASFLAFLITLFPFVSAWWICAPWVLKCFAAGSYLRGIAFFALYYGVFTVADTKAYAEGLGPDPYITSLAYFMGFYVFGIKGILLGPLTVCMGHFIYVSLGYKQQKKKTGLSEEASNNVPELSPDLYELCRNSFDNGRQRVPPKPSNSIDDEGHFISIDSRSRTRSTSEVITSYISDSISFLQTSFRDKPGLPSTILDKDQLIRFYLKIETEAETKAERPVIRMDMSRNSSYKELIAKIQDILGTEHIKGVFDKDGAEIRSVSSIDASEILTIICKEKEL